MEADQTLAATSPNRIASVARGVYLAALAAGVVWLAATRGGEVAELLERARLPLIAVTLAATFGLIFLTARFWVLSLRMAADLLPGILHRGGPQLGWRVDRLICHDICPNSDVANTTATKRGAQP